jgi:hypothetical protein
MGRLLTVGICIAMCGVIPALAQFTTYPTPVPAYTGGSTLMSIPGANFSTTTTLTDGAQTLTFSSAVGVRQVPGGGWATWNSPPNVESSAPKVLAITTGLTSLTITLGNPVTLFGVEIEPNSGTQAVALTYYNDATVLGSISQSVVGTSGAKLFAGSASTPITSVVLTIPSGASGFAMAQFRYGNTPTATTSTVVGAPALSLPAMGGLALLLVACGSLLARQQNRTQV